MSPTAAMKRRPHALATAVLIAAIVLAAHAAECRAAGNSRSPGPAANRALAQGLPAVSREPAVARSAKEAWEEGRRLADEQHYEEALAVIDAALWRAPDDVDLRWLKAGVTGWAGRHEESVALYLRLGADHPEMVDALSMDLAGERLAAGDQAAALQGLDRYLSKHPDDREARRLRARAISGEGAYATLYYSRSDDSDGTRRLSTELNYHRPMGPQSQLRVALQRDRVRESPDQRTLMRAGPGWEQAWSRRYSGNLMLQLLDPGAGRGIQGVGEVGFTIRPGSRLRIDVGLEREPVLKRQALDLNLMLWTAVAGVDWDAAERLTLRLSQRNYYYSDRNRQIRQSASAYTPIMVRAHGRLAGTLGLEHLQSAEDLDHGYYDPEQHLEYGPGIEAEWEPRDPWRVAVDAGTGWQRENDLAAEPFGTVRVELRAPLGSLFSLGAEVQRSDSNLRDDTGYRRSAWSLSVTTRF